MRWGAVVAAGGLVKDPLASAIGTPRKALAVVGGRSCLARTLDAVRDAGLVECATVSGEDVAGDVHHGWLVPELETQIENARKAVESLPGVDGVLFLPADTPLLTGAVLSAFMESVESRIEPGMRGWLAAGLCRASDFRAEFPRIPCQPIALSDGAFVSGALFAASPAAFLKALDLLAEMSASRKNQARMLLRLGPWTVLRYLMRRVSVREAEELLGRFFGGQAVIVTGCDPAMAADIDEVASYDELRIVAGLKSP